MFLERSLSDPPPPTTPLQAPFTATPLPIHHPFPPLKILIIHLAQFPIAQKSVTFCQLKCHPCMKNEVIWYQINTVSWYLTQWDFIKFKTPTIFIHGRHFNPIWHGGGGHDGPPKCFLPLCPNALEEEAETWWLLILIYLASKKVIFGSLGCPMLPWQWVCQGVLEIFWSYRSICFLITKF